jgi:hypothetical protein
MAIRPLNRKARVLAARPEGDVRPFNFGDCCPGFLPGWEVDDPSLPNGGSPDPCMGGWANDLAACQPGCYWIAQVGDGVTTPDWFRHCANISQDWLNLCTIPDTTP